MVKQPSRGSIPFDCPAKYQIIVEGWIDPSWVDRLEGMMVFPVLMKSNSQTILDRELIDQAALSGVLNTLYELHLPVVSVKRLDEGWHGSSL